MKKLFLFAVLVSGVAIVSSSALAHKYQRKVMTPPTPAAVAASEEKVTSMSDCMSFCASFQSKGKMKDMEMLKKQFGPPFAESGNIYEYNYDGVTKLILDCSKGSCHVRCLQKS